MTSLVKQNSIVSAKALFAREDVKQKFSEMLGKKATSFMTSVLQIVSQNDLLQKCDPNSIYQSAAVAATLDLPLNSNLGFAYIVPYKAKQKDNTYKDVAQFQMGYKGFIQLAQRSGQFKAISVAAIYKAQIVSADPLKGYEFDFTKLPGKDEKPAGYAAYFQLLNGFEKTLYSTVEELEKHGKRFSQTYKKGYGLWNDDFDSMASKTVLKHLLSKYAPLSVDMQKAVTVDQAVVNDADTMDVTYEDNDAPQAEAREAASESSAKAIDATVDKIAKTAETKPSTTPPGELFDGQ